MPIPAKTTATRMQPTGNTWRRSRTWSAFEEECREALEGALEALAEPVADGDREAAARRLLRHLHYASVVN